MSAPSESDRNTALRLPPWRYIAHKSALKARLCSMSAGLIADISICPLCARSGCEQPQQSVALFNHLVGASREPHWHVDTQRPGRLEIEHELELDALDHGQLTWLIAS